MANDAFITEDFLLETPSARRLYHDYARDLPIIDYHCHLPARQIAENHRFRNMTELWLEGDHYKWRALRTAGVPERLITGDAPDWEKFKRWAAIMPALLRNPLYHWTHLELKRYFDISDRFLNAQTARGIWEECNAQLAHPAMSCRGLMKQSNVVLVCTTDDPTDSLEHHQAIAGDPAFGIQVLPTWRPDKAMAAENPVAFNAWTDRLAEAADIDIRDFTSFLEALRKRQAFFHLAGCRLSDHGLETAYADGYAEAEIAAIFDLLRDGTELSHQELFKFKSCMLYEFGLMDHEQGWTQQYHIGPLRNTNSRMFKRLGPDVGFDSIGDLEVARPLARLLDRLDSAGRLARTILYNLNPRDSAVLATMIGNFQDGETPGKMQLGSAWWFLDQKDGIEHQLEILSQMGLLSRFVGMLTDSRSFLSYTRHEYFRRILCNILGGDMERGLIPADMDLVGAMVRDICYNNAAGYFGFNLPKAAPSEG